MSFKESRIAVSIAQTQTEVDEALEFCGSVYERNYGTRWSVPPDVFFVAREKGDIVATGGLTFAARHTKIASERYYRLTKQMRHFITGNRERVVEFGRFASVKMLGAKAIMHSALSYCTLAKTDYLFAWANPTVSRHTSRLGLDLWPISVPLDLNNAISDSRWTRPPTGFFVRKHPPVLHLIVVPFCENVIQTLAEECGMGMRSPEWQTPDPSGVHATTRKPASFVRTIPRLVRTEADVGRPGLDLDAIPNLSSLSGPDASLRRKPPQAE